MIGGGRTSGPIFSSTSNHQYRASGVFAVIDVVIFVPLLMLFQRFERQAGKPGLPIHEPGLPAAAPEAPVR